MPNYTLPKIYDSTSHSARVTPISAFGPFMPMVVVGINPADSTYQPAHVSPDPNNPGFFSLSVDVMELKLDGATLEINNLRVFGDIAEGAAIGTSKPVYGGMRVGANAIGFRGMSIAGDHFLQTSVIGNNIVNTGRPHPYPVTIGYADGPDPATCFVRQAQAMVIGTDYHLRTVTTGHIAEGTAIANPIAIGGRISGGNLSRSIELLSIGGVHNILVTNQGQVAEGNAIPQPVTIGGRVTGGNLNRAIELQLIGAVHNTVTAIQGQVAEGSPIPQPVGVGAEDAAGNLQSLQVDAFKNLDVNLATELAGEEPIPDWISINTKGNGNQTGYKTDTVLAAGVETEVWNSANGGTEWPATNGEIVNLSNHILQAKNSGANPLTVCKTQVKIHTSGDWWDKDVATFATLAAGANAMSATHEGAYVAIRILATSNSGTTISIFERSYN